MKTLLVILAGVMAVAVTAFAGGGIGVFGSYMNGKDVDSGFGGGIKFKGDIADYIAVEARASCLTKFSDYLEDDDLYVIPIEGDVLLNFPLGDSPVTIYGGGGAGYYIIPEYEDSVVLGDVDVDLQDTFGFFGVGGVEFALSEGVSLYAEGKYLLLTVDEAKIEDVDTDLPDEVDFSGLSLNAGLLFRF